MEEADKENSMNRKQKPQEAGGSGLQKSKFDSLMQDCRLSMKHHLGMNEEEKM